MMRFSVPVPSRRATHRALAFLLLSTLLSSCAAWPLLTGAAGLAVNKKSSNNFFMLMPLTSGGSSLDRIEITAPYSSFAKTTSMQLQATAIYSNSSRESITGTVEWSSSSEAIVSVAAGGMAQAKATGDTTITATYQGKTAQVALTVTPALLSSVLVTCVNSAAHLPVMVKRACTLTGTFADASHQDLTGIATWTSSDENVASVDASGVVTGVSAGGATITGSYGGRSSGLNLTVSGATILPGAAGLSISPADVALAVGEGQQFTAEGIFSDGSHQPMTSQVTWASADTAVAAFSNVAGEQGLLTAEGEGQTPVQATWYAASSTARVTVFSHHLVSISITPANPTVANGATALLTATGHFNDGSTSVITTQVTWSSDNTSVATVDNASPYQGRVTAKAASGSTTIRATVGGIEGTTVVTATDAVLDHLVLTLSDANHSIAKDTTTYLTVEGINSDGSSAGDVTALALVTSSNTSIVTVSTASGGLVPLNGISAGSVTITASYGGTSGQTGLTVTNATLASIQITPAVATIAVGESQAFTATGIFSNGTNQDLTKTVTWASSNTAVASISMASGTQGIATALSPGSSSSITATQNGILSPAATLNVSGEKILSSIAITTVPVGTTSIAKGMTLQFKATGTYSDLSTADITSQVGWDSDDHALAVLDANGLGTGVGETSGVMIRASMNGKQGTYSLAVTAAVLHHLVITLTDLDHSVAKDTTTYATAEGINTDGTSAGDLTSVAVWTATPPGRVTVGGVSAGSIPLTGVSTGTATIQATYSGKSGSTTLAITGATLSSIQVTPINPTIANGESVSFTATGLFSDGTSQDLTRTATWISSNALVATVSNAAGFEGKATAVSPGSTTSITATQSGVVSAPSVLTVSGTKVLQSIGITTLKSSMASGTDTQLNATGHYSDGSTADITGSVSWSSGSPAVATVGTPALGGSTPGLVHGTGPGTATITASLGPVSQTFEVTVTAAELVSIQVNLAASTIARGTSTTAQAIGTYTDGTTQNLTANASLVWAASGTNIIVLGTINTGAAPAYPSINLSSPKAGNTGASSITATLGAIASPAVTLTVGSAVLDRVEVYCPNLSTVVGLSQNCQATGILTDDSTQDLTLLATWQSSNAVVASINSSGGADNGVLTALAVGDTNITATHGGKTSVAAAVHVVAKTLQSITIAPAPTLNLPRGTTHPFTATLHYNDGTNPVEPGVTWTSSEPGCVSISAGGLAQAVNGLLGYITCNATEITASFDGIISAATVVDVTAPTLQSITIAPGNGSLAKGQTRSYTATGNYSDGSTQDLTAGVAWTSTNLATATINSAGVASALAMGSTSITATDAASGVTSSVSLEVTAAAIVSITVGPTNPTIYAGVVNNTHQFTATARYSDYPSTADADVTASVTWSSSNTSIATVSNGAGTQGLVTSGTSTGSASITALDAATGVSGSNSVTVVADTTAPTVDNVTSLGALVVRVTFSEPVNASNSEATNPANYKIALTSSVVGYCSNNGANFLSSSAALPVSSVTAMSSSVFDLTLSSPQTAGTDYTLLVNRSGIHDLGLPTPNLLGCPNSGSFTGMEQLRVTQARATDTTHVIVSFSKDVLGTNNSPGSAGCTGGTECSYRYKLIGGKDLGDITSARVLNGSACGSEVPPADVSKVCITHTGVQTGAMFTVIVANGMSGDGFDNAWGSIRNSLDNEGVQAIPRDRATFTGAGPAPVVVTDGPLVDNPFGDDSDFGNLTAYNGMIYIGPNFRGNGATRFTYEGLLPMGISFTFTKDVTTTPTTRVSENTGASSYVTIGHKGCSRNSAALSTGCGPDNENGRGAFVTGTLGTTPYIFIAGARDPVALGTSQPDFNYVYYSADLANTLNFRYVDTGSITGSADAGASSILVLNSRIYLGAAKENFFGSVANTPDLGYVSFNGTDTGNGSPSYCTIGLDCDATDGTKGRRFYINALARFGGMGVTTGENSSPNYGYYTGVDTQFVFNNYVYAANGGYRQLDHNGSVIRSKTSDPRLKCTAPNTCSDWMEIGPRTHAKWHHSDGSVGDVNNWFSLDLGKLFDLIPADRAVSMFESYGGKLYMTRTICVTSNDSANGGYLASTLTPASNPAYTGCLDGTYTNRRPQLWKCDPTNGGADTANATTCEANEWSLVGDDGTGITNFGHAGNHSITMVKKNGSYLYVAFDNVGGLELWRTNVANPGASHTEWEQVGVSGLNGPNPNTGLIDVQQFFSAVSVQPGGSGPWYLYLSVGKNGVPVKVYRQQND